MQVKKQAIKKNILRAAESEFIAFGYNNTSIRRIVTVADTTIGNFYNYFTSKEEVFSVLIEDAYHSFTSLLNNHQTLEKNNILWEMSEISIWRQKLLVLFEKLLPNMNNQFILLLDASQDTKYAHVKEDLLILISNHFIEHIKDFSPSYKYVEMAPILSNQFVSSLIYILKTTTDNHTKKKLLVEQILFFAIGVMGLLGGSIHDSSK